MSQTWCNKKLELSPKEFLLRMSKLLCFCALNYSINYLHSALELFHMEPSTGCHQTSGGSLLDRRKLAPVQEHRLLRDKFMFLIWPRLHSVCYFMSWPFLNIHSDPVPLVSTPGFGYTHVEWEDMDMDGNSDVITIRAKPTGSELVWLQQPPTQSAWSAHVLDDKVGGKLTKI